MRKIIKIALIRLIQLWVEKGKKNLFRSLNKLVYTIILVLYGLKNRKGEEQLKINRVDLLFQSIQKQLFLLNKKSNF